MFLQYNRLRSCGGENILHWKCGDKIVKTAASMLLFCCVGCAGAGLLGQPKTFQRAESVPPLGQNVSAILSVLNNDNLVYENEPLVLELKLANISASDVSINNELQLGRLVVIEILGNAGEYKRSPEPARWQDSLAEHRYVTLPPGVFVGRQYQIRPTDPRWQLATGSYSVRVVYRNSQGYAVASSLLEEGDIRRLGEKAVVPLLTGSAVSNVERFNIVSGKRKK